MFERFTHEARLVVVAAQEEARALHHGYIGTEHLLLAMLHDATQPTNAVLSQHGMTHQAVIDSLTGATGADDLDPEALRTLGVDLHSIRDKVEASFGKGALDTPSHSKRKRRPFGHIPFTRRAKKAMELALREAINLKHNYIADGHLLLGLLRENSATAVRVLRDHRVDLEELRSATIATLTPRGHGRSA